MGGVYRKQVGMNQFCLKGAGRVQVITLPAVHPGLNTALRDVRISYADTSWPVRAARSVEATLQRSPFYAHFGPDIIELLQKRTTFLVDFNLQALSLLIRNAGLALPIEESDENWQAAVPTPWRAAQPVSGFLPISYFQQFGPFVSNLSMLDLMCNQGGQVIHILQQMTAATAKE